MPDTSLQVDGIAFFIIKIMAKLGFTFYPKDWWTSDTFFDLDADERYIYLEMIFLMYQNGGYINLTKPQIELRLRTQIKPNVWDKITQLLTCDDLGYTLKSVAKRKLKADTSKINGKKGGRPPKQKEPNNPALNPPLEKKEKENRKERNIIPPITKSVNSYFEIKKSNTFEANKFYSFYSSNGWKVGKNKMIDWHAAASGWISRNESKPNQELTSAQRLKLLSNANGN